MLASFLRSSSSTSLSEFLTGEVFDEGAAVTVAPTPSDLDGFAAYLDRYRLALPLQRAAADATPTTSKEGATA
ncbi:hypothetical protein GCM10025867_41690 [Frondihabitans sucicola]|uniref:Uncharacterized protein n=1 Tax=Frondihabitans sucicola TaxID=1268041 RepID=A0ABM8GTZ7_9MICO|nr:hypothetical protein GCM10025867_41690 [Frondihabitans sucicola]